MKKVCLGFAAGSPSSGDRCASGLGGVTVGPGLAGIKNGHQIAV
ncbi:MAG: hypothetical protein ABSA92_10070 [Candidatus Bathyarchaeia archaeon]